MSAIGRRGGVKNWSKLLTDFTKKLPILGRGCQKSGISTQQTVVENDFNAKQRAERLHFIVGYLKSGTPRAILYPGPVLM